MKRFFIILFILFCANSAVAQFNIGIKGGVIANLYDIDFKKINEFDVKQAGKNAGFNIGIQARFNTKMGLYVATDVLYSYLPEKIKIYDGVDHSELLIRRHGLEIPVLVGFKIAFFRIYLGPKFYARLGEDVKKTLGNNDEIKYDFGNETFGYQVGIGFDILKKLSIDVTYNGRFARSDHDIIFDSVVVPGQLSNSQLWISLGWLF